MLDSTGLAGDFLSEVVGSNTGRTSLFISGEEAGGAEFPLAGKALVFPWVVAGGLVGAALADLEFLMTSSEEGGGIWRKLVLVNSKFVLLKT